MSENQTKLYLHVESGDYPINFYQIGQREKNLSLDPNASDEELEGYGYAVVQRTERPTSGVVTELSPVLTDGVWVQTWDRRDYTAEEEAARVDSRRVTWNSQADNVREKDIAYGLRFDFQDGGEGGVQLREGDRTNHFGLRLKADAYIAAGQPEELIEFRTLENVTKLCTATEIVALTNAALDHVARVYAASWAFKDKVLAAQTVADLPVVPESFLTETQG